jgi:hypothetical protein
MASTSPTRIDDQLYALAKAAGAVNSRSASQQITHWARLGRELEAASSVSPREIADVLSGHGDYDGLNTHEQAIVRTEWAERMTNRLTALDLASEFTAAGQTYAELDEHGYSVRRTPSTPE